MKQLDPGYTVKVDQIDKAKWHNFLQLFEDVSFYQTWSYGKISWGEKSLSHLVLEKNDKIVSMAQLRIVKMPLLQAGIAYLIWGPMWRKKGEKASLNTLRNMLQALYNEYVMQRGYLLKILPKSINEDEDNIREIFQNEGFSWSPDLMKTVFVDLTPSLDEIKKNTRRKWRQTLNRAGKREVEFFAERDDDEICKAALAIIKEMKIRKRYTEFGSMEDNLDVHKDLPEDLKLNFVLCKYNNEPISVLGWFPIGKIGLVLVGATGNNALKLNASYSLYWKMIEYYKRLGSSKIDLAGINKEKNPGGYTFKTGLAGKNRVEKNYIGQFDACENKTSSICFKTAWFLRDIYRNAMYRLKKYFN